MSGAMNPPDMQVIASPARDSSHELGSLMRTLPQELYDKIYDDVFTAEPSIRLITPSYKPPKLLHVSKASRQQYAKSYFNEGSKLRIAVPNGFCRTGDLNPQLKDAFKKYANSIDRNFEPLVTAIELLVPRCLDCAESEGPRAPRLARIIGIKVLEYMEWYKFGAGWRDRIKVVFEDQAGCAVD